MEINDKDKFISKDPEKRANQLKNLRPDASLKHGAFSRSNKTWFTEEEQALFEEMFEDYKSQYQLEDSADLDSLRMMITAFIKQSRINKYEIESGKPVSDRVKDYSAEFAKYLQLLGLDRRFKKSNENADNAHQMDLAQIFMIKPAKKEDDTK